MRIKRGNVCRNRHKKILKLAKGFKGARSRIFKVANIAVMKALKYAYRDRIAKKRNMRRSRRSYDDCTRYKYCRTRCT